MRYVPEAYLFETIQEVIEALWDMYQKIETVILTESIGIAGKNVFCFVFSATWKMKFGINEEILIHLPEMY